MPESPQAACTPLLGQHKRDREGALGETQVTSVLAVGVRVGLTGFIVLLKKQKQEISKWPSLSHPLTIMAS